MRKSLYISGLLSTLLLSGGVDAAGLGRLIVNSSLGQPLRAEIELLAVSKEELGSIGATLASREVFRQARIERTEAVNALRFSIDQRPNGKPVLRITSTAPIQDPFLDVLIELSWGSGRLLREYTILLDPPADARPATTVAPQPAAVTPPMARGAVPPPVSSVPEPTPEMLRQRSLPTDIPPPKAAAPYGPVRAGETLRGIATKTLPDGITLEQMMVGIYHRNRDAFLNNNMSFLKKGATLKLPGHDDAMQVDQGRALREVRMHAADWNAYRRQLAAAAGADTDAAVPESQAAAGRVVPKVEDKAAPPPAAGKDMLKLSRGEPAGTGKEAAKNLEKIQALEEELAAKGRALQEAQDRVTKLEQTVHDMQRLLELKAQEAARTAEPPVVPIPEPTAAPAAEEPVAAPTPPAPQEKAMPPAMAAPIPVSTETSWLSTFVGNPLYIGGIVAAVLLSSLLWLMVVGSRRRKGLNSFEDSIMTGGEFKKDAVFTTGTGAAAGTATEGSMLLTDFSRLGLGAIDTHEVDPIAEAEVYMAYGRDAQAEEILREALSKDPGRHELTIKLLEIYSSRKDPVSFETLASELYASLGGQPTEVWQKAADMGRTLDPDNPLYRIAPIVAAAPAKAPLARFSAEKAQEEEQEFTGTFEDVAWIHAVSGSGEQETPDVAEETAESLSGLEAEDHLIDFDSFAVEEDQASIESAETETQQPAEAETQQPAEVEDLFDLPAEQEAPEPFDVELPEEIGPVEEAVVEEMPLPQVEELEEEPFSPEDLDVLLEEGDKEEPPPVELPEEEEGVSVEEAYRSIVSETDAPLPTVESGIPEPEAEDEAETQAGMPDLDFSDIDLELAEATPEPSPIEVSEPQVEEVVAQPVATPEGVIDPEIWEETNTKLDLARAYLDMGDKEGAREILQEVLTDGDAQQQESAGKLLHEAD